jgi:hypothetical protein
VALAPEFRTQLPGLGQRSLRIVQEVSKDLGLAVYDIRELVLKRNENVLGFELVGSCLGRFCLGVKPCGEASISQELLHDRGFAIRCLDLTSQCVDLGAYLQHLR